MGGDSISSISGSAIGDAGNGIEQRGLRVNVAGSVPLDGLHWEAQKGV